MLPHISLGCHQAPVAGAANRWQTEALPRVTARTLFFYRANDM
jgi:hypothetical protein